MENQTGWNQFKGKETPSTVEIHDIFFQKVPKGSEIIDFGCAWGRIAFQLQRNGYNVTGFDSNDNAIAEAQETARKTNGKHKETVKFQNADALKLTYPDESFDACIIQAFLTTIITPEERIRIIDQAHRILKHDGILYIADFGQNWQDPIYSERYNQDYSVTGEIGTFIVTEDGTQRGKELFMVHHYTADELTKLVKSRFNIETMYESVFTTFHGNETLGYVMIARKL